MYYSKVDISGVDTSKLIVLKEAEKMGFKTFVVPESGKKQIKYKTTSINVIGVKTISEALRVCGF